MSTNGHRCRGLFLIKKKKKLPTIITLKVYNRYNND